MDNFGMRLPSIYENKDIAIIYNKQIKSAMIRNLIQEDERKNRIYFDANLGVKKLKTIKNQYLRKGVRIIIVQNIKDGIESFKVYSINDGKQIIHDLSGIKEIIKNAKENLDIYYYKLNDKKLDDIREAKYGTVSEFNSKGKVV